MAEENGNGTLQLKELEQNLHTLAGNNELLQEQIAELELALEDVGWQRMSFYADREFSLQGLRRIRRLARLTYLQNPLIHHAVEVQAHYVWGQGCSIAADSPDVNEVLQDFLDDPKNTVSFSGHQARLDKERMLILNGDLFFALFTNQSTGRVIVRNLNPDEIEQIITNPQDWQEPWYYKRVWNEMSFNPIDAAIGGSTKVAYYPDWRLIYNRDSSVQKPKMIGSDPVMWDSPVYHVKVGGLSDMRFGVPEIYSALNWATAVKDDLSNYATIKKAHARFAWSLSTKGGKAGVAAGKKSLNTTLSADGAGQLDTNPPPVTASTFIKAEGWDLQPMKVAGTQPSPDEGRRLGLMVSAGTGIPETILFGDAEVGNLATSKTLDRPTELQMENRRTLWSDVYADILNYVIDMAVMCPNGALDGDTVVDDAAGLLYVELAPDPDADPDNPDYDPNEPASRNISITFPAILQVDKLPLVQAIVQAVTLNNYTNAGLIDDRTAAEMLLNALGADEIDETLDLLFPDNEITTDAGTAAANPNNDEDETGGMGDTGEGDMGDAGGPPNTSGAGITMPDMAVSPDIAMIAALRTFTEIVKPMLQRNELTLDEVLDPLTDLNEPRGVYVHKKRGVQAKSIKRVARPKRPKAPARAKMAHRTAPKMSAAGRKAMSNQRKVL